ncbi:hypothetical protein [Rhodococcus sp. JVH1]|uniref:hypothetical protein n=1 Tax=Rhodococcus sp. JVH1 TaxID=745408 RepID=UPI000272134D|nr:hypothetical protein [Rhodococcus sp. JVH1]EJI95747.1 hypothetical protein JVH1_6768 [Rhodococcus sp. JVH1]
MNNDSTFPVTVAVARYAKPAHGDALESWAHALCTSARDFPGFLGSNVRTSDRGGAVEIVIGLSFSHPQDLSAWEQSEQRAGHLRHGDVLTEGSDVGLTVDDFLGNGAFGSRPGRPAVAPARWKTAVVVWLALYPVATLSNFALSPHLRQLPVAMGTLITTLLLVPFVVWVGVPAVHRGWNLVSARRRA